MSAPEQFCLEDLSPSELSAYIHDPATSLEDVFAAKSVAVRQITAAIELSPKHHESPDVQAYMNVNNGVLAVIAAHLDNISVERI